MDGLTSTFPPPPFYYRSFTEENVEKIAELDSKDNLEPPLAYLVPPTPPEQPTYRGFGSVWNTQEKLIPLEEAGVKQLYGDMGSDYKGLVDELKKLLRSALVKFVALTGAMSVDPETFPQSIEDLRTIFINMHHLLNLYRPHQSRESIIFLMQDQIAEIKAGIEATRSSNESITARIDQLTGRFPQINGVGTGTKSIPEEWKSLGLSIDPQEETADEGANLDDMVIE